MAEHLGVRDYLDLGENFDSVRRLLIVQHEALCKTDEQLMSLEDTKMSYVRLLATMQELPKRVKQTAIVPFSKKAFVVGELIRTNEIHLLLGCDYWAHVSASEACDIFTNRVRKIEEQLGKLREQRDLLDERRRFTLDLLQEEPKDLKEVYDESQEAQWRARHWERVREESKSSKAARISFEEKEQEDRALWKRLDELELEEVEKEVEKGLKKVRFLDDQPQSNSNVLRIEACSSEDSDDAVSDEDADLTGPQAQRIHFLGTSGSQRGLESSVESSGSRAFSKSVKEQVVERQPQKVIHSGLVPKDDSSKPLSRFKAMRQGHQ